MNSSTLKPHSQLVPLCSWSWISVQHMWGPQEGPKSLTIGLIILHANERLVVSGNTSFLQVVNDGWGRTVCECTPLICNSLVCGNPRVCPDEILVFCMVVTDGKLKLCLLWTEVIMNLEQNTTPKGIEKKKIFPISFPFGLLWYEASQTSWVGKHERTVWT